MAVCKVCGANNTEGKNFCDFCGSPLSDIPQSLHSDSDNGLTLNNQASGFGDKTRSNSENDIFDEDFSTNEQNGSPFAENNQKEDIYPVHADYEPDSDRPAEMKTQSGKYTSVDKRSNDFDHNAIWSSIKTEWRKLSRRNRVIVAAIGMFLFYTIIPAGDGSFLNLSDTFAFFIIMLIPLGFLIWMSGKENKPNIFIWTIDIMVTAILVMTGFSTKLGIQMSSPFLALYILIIIASLIWRNKW